jgi:hypothetical protein
MDVSNCVNDDDVWFDSQNHPGTKVYRKTTRLVVDEFLHEEYSKSIYKAMKSKLNGRNFYFGDPPRLCNSSDLVDIFGDSFEKEQTKRKEKQRERALEHKSRSQSSLLRENSTPAKSLGRKMSRSQSSSQCSSVSENNTPEITGERKMSRSQSSSVRENNRPAKSLGRKSSSQSSLVREDNTPAKSLGRKLRRSQSSSQSSSVRENNTPEITRERKSRSQSSSQSSSVRENNAPEMSPGRKSCSQGSSRESTPERTRGRNKSRSQSSLPRDSPGRNKSRSQSSLPRDHTRENSDDAEALRRSKPIGRYEEPPTRRGVKLLNRVGEEAKETLSFNDDDDVYLDEEDQPGTQALKEVVKRAVSEFAQEEYSSSIFKWIRQEVRGRRIFQTLDSQFVEASKKDLVDIFGDLYDYECKMFRKMKKAEKYMAEANKWDVYFDVPDYSGTRAWKRVVRHLAEANPDEIYCKDIFTEIRLQLDGSSYYNGKPPKCHKARKQDILIRFGECFDDEKASIMGQRSRTTAEVLLKDKSSKGALRRGRRCDSTKSETECSDASTTFTCRSGKRRPVPGYLYWILLHQMISNRLARWDWYQRTSHGLCRRVATNSIVVRMQPYWMSIKEACGKDPESGEDLFDRLATAIEIKVFGRSWPFIFLIGVLCAIGVFSIIYAIGKKLLLGLIL